ncbi:unnamed protein product [Polarella glacialis]|uniref:MAPEG family protein n=1 Tax=Polarella glacialis TaxID=89957 RepID=A0A813IHE8_POLGL|nr:unnamed protein product [Polarella glacialis]CAE8649564.1 unnamed protein product [Polarella glacialis]
MAKQLPVFFLMPRLIGTAIAMAIYWPGRATYDQRMSSINGIANGDLELGYVYLAAGVLSILGWFLNSYPMLYKSAVMPGNAGNLRANMQIYKVNTQKGGRMPAVVLEDEGAVGQYNRANRALFHFVENVAPLLPCIFLAGLIFSKAMLALVVVYAVARVWYQVAYSTGGYGMGLCKHALPFFVHTIFVANTIEMLTWIAGVRLLQLQ